MFTYPDRSTSTTNTTNFLKYNIACLLHMITKVVEYEMIAYNKIVMFFVVGDDDLPEESNTTEDISSAADDSVPENNDDNLLNLNLTNFCAK